MRVLQLVKTSHGARWAVEQVRELCRMGIEVHVALPDLSGGFSNAWVESGAKIHIQDTEFPAKAPWRLPSVLKSFRNLVEQVQPDLIHSHFVSNTLTMRMALKDDTSIHRLFQVPGPLHLENILFRNWELSTSNAQDHWIASSHYIHDLYRKAGIVEERLFTSYYGNYQNEQYETSRDELRALFGINPHELVVGSISYMYPPKYFLGQMRGLKRHEALIDAFSHLGELRNDVTGLLIGGQWGNGKSYERRLRRRAARVRTMRVTLPGALPPQNSAGAWPLFDLVVHIPSTENCGGVVEPLAAGVPVLASKVGGLPEVIIDGVTGVLIDRSEPRDIAIAINRALKDLPSLQATALTGRNLVRTMFDVRRTAEEVGRIYAHIIKGDPRPVIFDSVAFSRTHAAKRPTLVSSNP